MGKRRLALDMVAMLMIGVLAFSFWPARFGGDTTFVVVSGESMEPRLHDRDFVVVRAADDYDVGDVVAFRIPAGHAAAGSLVIHRIVDVLDRGFLTRGDNRQENDAWFPTEQDVVGRVVVVAPILGGLIRTVLPWSFSAWIGIGIIWLLWPKSDSNAPLWPPPAGEPQGFDPPVAMRGFGANASLP